MSFGDPSGRFRHMGLACLTTCLLLSPVMGCGQAAPTPDPAAITFAHLDADTEYFEDLATKFHESHPHITVRLRPAYDDDIDGIGPDEADVRVTWEGGVGRLQEQGALLSLDPFIQEDESIDLSDFYPGTIWTLEGRTWAIPAGVDPAVMYYNRGLFDQYHVPYPEPKWIVFLSEQMPHRLVPARRSLAESSEFGQLVGSDVAVVARLSLVNSMLVSPRIHDAFTAQMEIFMVAIGKIVDGSWTPQEAMDWAQLEFREQM